MWTHKYGNKNALPARQRQEEISPASEMITKSAVAGVFRTLPSHSRNAVRIALQHRS